MTGALDAFARFFRLDADLVEAAAERPAGPTAQDPLSSDVIRRALADLPDREKTTLLARVIDGDPHVGNELRALVRDRQETSAARPAVAPRSAGELRARADAIREAREREQSERREAERNRLEAEEARARRARLDAIMRRGETVWREVDRNRAPQCSRLRYGRRSSARPQGDRRGAGDGWRVRPPAAGDPRMAYPQGALHRTAEANRIAWHAIAASHSRCRSPAGFPMRTGQSSPSAIGYM